VSINIVPSRQRVPMLTASTLEDRTRPALDGSASSRLRYFRWPTWMAATGEQASAPKRPTQARLGRR